MRELCENYIHEIHCFLWSMELRNIIPKLATVLKVRYKKPSEKEIQESNFKHLLKYFMVA